MHVTTQPLNMEFLPQIAQIYADLKPPKVVYWLKLIKKDFILICDVCVICGKYLFMNSLNRLSSYKKTIKQVANQDFGIIKLFRHAEFISAFTYIKRI